MKEALPHTQILATPLPVRKWKWSEQRRKAFAELASATGVVMRYPVVLPSARPKRWRPPVLRNGVYRKLSEKESPPWFSAEVLVPLSPPIRHALKTFAPEALTIKRAATVADLKWIGKNLPKLRMLYLNGVTLNQKAIQAICRSLPTCHIEVNRVCVQNAPRKKP